MAINVAAISAVIASASPAGIACIMRDTNNMVTVVECRWSPTLMPSGPFVMERHTHRTSFGGAGAKWDSTVTLEYTYYHASPGNDRNLSDLYPSFSVNQQAIDDALRGATYPNGVMLRDVDWDMFQLVSDPSGNQNHGCHVRLTFGQPQ